MLSVGDVHKVLQNLLRERVSIRDLVLILETLANHASRNKNSEVLTEYVRNALASRICEVYRNSDGIIPVITLDPNLEAKLEGALQEVEGTFRFALPPSDVGRIVEKTAATIDQVKTTGELPIVICAPTIRSQFRRMMENSHRDLVVLSYNEIIAGVEIRSLGMVALN
jgi:flagellar biosynthesis protein FlhA